MPWGPEAQPAVGILVAALGGAAVGLERQWSGHATGPEAHFAGIRTFTMLGALAGIAGWLWLSEMELLAGILLAGGVAVVAAASIAASRRTPDATTEVAGLIVLGAGVVAGTNHLGLASGTIVLTTLLLEEKSRLHAIVRRIDEVGLRASLTFAVMALVVLPLLPRGPYGLWGGIRPRLLWLTVLFFSGLSFAGFIARRLAGPRRGYLVSGMLGGLISSTSVALAFARQSRDTKEPAVPLALGVIAASTIMNLRVLFATSVLNPPVAAALLPYLAAPLVVGAATVYFSSRRSSEDTSAVEPPRNPLQFVVALEMALLFQVVLFGVYLAQRFWAQTGVLASGAILGLTDLDALTFTMAKGASGSFLPEVAAKAIAIGILSNTLLKLGMGLAIGREKFQRLASGGLAALAVASAASLVWWG